MGRAKLTDSNHLLVRLDMAARSGLSHACTLSAEEAKYVAEILVYHALLNQKLPDAVEEVCNQIVGESPVPPKLPQPPIGTLIRQQRESNGLSIRKLAKLSELSPTFILGLERDGLVPGAAAAGRLLDALDMPTEGREQCIGLWSKSARKTVAEWNRSLVTKCMLGTNAEYPPCPLCGQT